MLTTKLHLAHKADSVLLPTFILPIDSQQAQPASPEINENINMAPDKMSQKLPLEICTYFAMCPFLTEDKFISMEDHFIS